MSALAGMRKVRTLQSAVLDNIQAGRPDGQCNREQTAAREGGKGERVVQETTGDPGDRAGLVNPTESKTKQEHGARFWRTGAARLSLRVGC